MKRLVVVVGAAIGAWSLVAGPMIDSTTMSFTAKGTKAEIGYTLAVAPAIVTVDIQTNTLTDASGEWVSIGGEKIQSLSGDVNKMIRDLGNHKIVWNAGEDWGLNKRLSGGIIRAEVTAWATNAPPEWMAIGLRQNGDVRFYASSNFVPQGVTSDLYKSEQILMRKIHAAGVEWIMGETKAQADAATSNIATRDQYYKQEPAHKVMLAADYYIGIYPVTLGQYTNMCNRAERGDYNKYIDVAVRPFCPIDNASVTAIRGTTTTAYRWPENGHQVGSSSALYGLRSKCGLDDMDLPTEEQWEFACRAGTTTSLNSGKAYSTLNCEELGWITSNCMVVTNENGSACRQVHPVGLKTPNAWGLYDMHGNVMQATLTRGLFYEGPTYSDQLVDDWQQGGVTIAPLSYTIGTGVIKRGGGMNNSESLARSGHREGGSYGYSGQAYGGFRLSHPAFFK